MSLPNVLACYDKRSYACRKRAEDLIPMGDAILLDGEPLLEVSVRHMEAVVPVAKQRGTEGEIGA